MMPLAVADHPSTKRMFYLVNPEFKPTSRRTVGRDIGKLMERYILVFCSDLLLCLKLQTLQKWLDVLPYMNVPS